jgi:glycosyltransferase involved in cell wall biosynthesis
MGKPIRERLVLAGPCPPPDSGTTVNFKLFTDYVQQHFAVEAIILDFGRGGSKRGLPLLHWRVLRSFAERSWKIFRAQWGSRKIVIHGSYRFICTAAALYTWILAVLFRKQVFLYVNGGGFDNYLRSLHSAHRHLATLCLCRAAAVHVQTECSEKVLSGQLPGVRAVPNWRQLPRLHPEKLASPAVRFVYGGDLRNEKGIAELLAGFAEARQRLRTEGIPVTLDLYGPLFREMEASVGGEIARPASEMRWHGNVSNPALLAALPQYDVLVFPTKCYNEGHPGVVIEAMALGLAVVAAEWRAAAEVIEDGVDGLICPPGDAAALAECMCRIARDGELRRRLGAKAARAAARFDAATVLPRLCSLYGLDAYRRRTKP